jgi:hypothetical protein
MKARFCLDTVPGGFARQALNRELRLSLALLLGGASCVATAQVDLDRVTRCMQDNLPKSLRVDSVSLVAVDRSGAQRQISGALRAESKGQSKRLVWSVRAPADLAGSALLSRQDQNGTQSYLYLPSLGRVRRIDQNEREGSMFGTDISYGDAERIASTFGESAMTVLGDTTVAGRPAWKLAVTTPPDVTALYDRIDLSIDQQTCVAMQADFLHNDTAQKRWTADPAGLTRSGRYWYAASGVMRNLLQNTETRVHLGSVSTDVQLPASSFDPNSFYRAGN